MAATWTMPSSSLDEIGLGVSPLEKNPSESQSLEGQRNRMYLGRMNRFFWDVFEDFLF